ncbi:MAG: DegV family protein [Anaerolineae bacterium]|nr:DegV family protein [Anaerolineae bacterium]
MGRKIRIITDSVADVPWQTVLNLGVDVVPVYLLLGEKSYLVDEYLDLEWFYSELDRSLIPLKTAAPSPEEFLVHYQQLVNEEAREIIGLFTPATLSSIANNAQIAARQLVGARVHIVETGQISMGLGWLVIAAAEAALQGASVGEIITLVKTMSARTLVLGMLDSLDHLRRSGRVSWATARVADLLQIKPIITFKNGEAKLRGRVRTHHRALSYLLAQVQSLLPIERLAILHSRVAADVLAQLCDSLMPYAVSVPSPLVEVGPIFGTHVGPRAIGVALVQAESEG